MHLPWLMPNLRKKTRAPFECESCLPKETETKRRVMHCGHIPRDRWAEGKIRLPVLGPHSYDATGVCPGYLARLDGVVEGRDAYVALEAGTLHIFDPHLTHTVYEAAMVAKAAFDMHTAEQLRPENRPGAG